MLVEILSIPENLHFAWKGTIAVGDRFPIYSIEFEDCDMDLEFFDIDGRSHCLGDLVLQKIEFKVINEEAQ